MVGGEGVLDGLEDDPCRRVIVPKVVDACIRPKPGMYSMMNPYPFSHKDVGSAVYSDDLKSNH